MRKILGDYKKDIRIPENADYHEEWNFQPSAYVHYGDLWADATEEKDFRKLDLEVIESKIDEKIRQYPEKYGFIDGKPTEAAIKIAIKRDSDFIEAQRAYIRACTIVNRLTVAKTGFEQRKKALENKVSLHITGFHAEPRNKVRLLKEREARAEKNKQKEELKKRLKEP